ncbi:MAG: ABC transporter ATP-binding protein [Flavobacteriales bacterium]|nr:ABC transporter ATP-binding protein [Flavobacteriales bacterium]
MIQIVKLSKKYGKVQVLQELDLEIPKGGVFTILGPNGSGKTTLLKSILGMVRPNKGQIVLNGQSILGEWTYRNNLNYLPQIANFPSNLTVNELINFIKNLRKTQTNEQELIADFKLEPFLNQKLGNLSGGTRQKVNLVLCFMFDSELFILDEPTSGLDPVALIILKKHINNQRAMGKTLLISSHIMSFVEEISDQIVFLLEGKIYFKGSISYLIDQTKTDNLEHAIAQILQQND